MSIHANFVCHSLRGSVDWNVAGIGWSPEYYGHSLRGSVDWNIIKNRAAVYLYKSLPTRECGLKSIWIRMPFNSVLSLPTRECGLKFAWHMYRIICIIVTPYAGVWIEIPYKVYVSPPSIVTPYAGVWIEILKSWSIRLQLRSLPTRECGLK